MKKQRKSSALAAVILYGLTAAVWIVNCACTLSDGQMGFLQLAAAVLWIAAFIAQLRRYFHKRAEETEE